MPSFLENLMGALQSNGVYSGVQSGNPLPGIAGVLPPSVVGGAQTQAVDGRVAREVQGVIPAASRIPGAPDPARFGGYEPTPGMTPTVYSQPAQVQTAPAIQEDAPMAAATPAPRATAPAEPEPAAAGGIEGLFAGKDLRSMLADFMTGIGTAETGGITGIGQSFMGAQASRQTREDRKKAELAAANKAALDMEDRQYRRGRDAADDSRADRRLSYDMSRDERAAERQERTDALAIKRAEIEDKRAVIGDKKADAELRRLERLEAQEGRLTLKDRESLVNDFRKSIKPEYETDETKAEVERQVADYRKSLEPASVAGASPTNPPGPSATQARKEGDVVRTSDGSLQVWKSGKWAPYQ